MKRLATILILFMIFSLNAQPWHYDFGTGTGSWTSGVSETFLPQPPSGNDRVRIADQGGSFNLDNPGLVSLGSESELRGVASYGGKVNKFSIYDYNGGTGFTIRFYIQLDGGNSGTWYFFQGDGYTYSDNNIFSTAQVFTGIKWVFGDNNSITTSYRNGSSWSVLTGVMASQGVVYLVDIYGNNGSTTSTYHYGGQVYSVAPNKWDLWVNGVLVGDDLNKAGLADGNQIDSYMFYGENSQGNVATIYLDDIYYTNEVSDQSLPITLSQFSAKVTNNNISLFWTTQSEMDNAGFEILRSTTRDGDYQTIATYLSNPALQGQGNSNDVHQYSFVDRNVTPGQTYWYKLVDVDFNGHKMYHGPISATVPMNGQIVHVSSELPNNFRLYPNYPNPFNPTTTLKFDIPDLDHGAPVKVSLVIYNSLGEVVKEFYNGPLSAGTFQVVWDGRNEQGVRQPSGIYYAVLRADYFSNTVKMILIK